MTGDCKLALALVFVLITVNWILLIGETNRYKPEEKVGDIGDIEINILYPRAQKQIAIGMQRTSEADTKAIQDHLQKWIEVCNFTLLVQHEVRTKFYSVFP